MGSVRRRDFGGMIASAGSEETINLLSHFMHLQRMEIWTRMRRAI